MASRDPDRPETRTSVSDGEDSSPQESVDARIKGIAMKGAIDALLSEEAAARAVTPSRLQHYLDQPILVSSWYPEEDHYALMEVIAEVFGRPGKDVWFWMGRSTASRDLNNLYKAMVQEGQPITTLKRFPKLWRLYRTAGHVKVQTIGSSKGLVRIYDYPFVNVQFAKLIAGFLSEAITISGGKKVVVNPTSTGQKVGLPAIWVVSWSL